MYYSSFCILAVIHHLILNYDVLKNGKKKESSTARYRYRQFLNALLLFYITDCLWGFLVDLKIRPLAYADTTIFFLLMGLSVLLWTRYVAAFLDKKRLRAKSFVAAGWIIFIILTIGLIINIFDPIIFYFSEDTVYEPRLGRYVFIILQLMLFTVISVYSFFVSQKSEGRERIRYMAVGASGTVMAVLILLQNYYPLAPLYTIGCLFANCLLHVFVEQDEKKEQVKITEAAKKDREIYNQVAQSLATDYDAIYYINIETGKYLEISTSKSYRALDVPEEGRDFYEETRENVRRYVHPDDRFFAESMYYRETMQRNLEGRRSYSYKYRIMSGDEARYYRFVVMLSEDEKHFVLCDKDIHETITAESAMLEKQKATITYTQIAESLASNYDVIYYVDPESGEYAGYTSRNFYGELKVNDTGTDFFGEVTKNTAILVHPQDRDRILSVLNRDYMLTALGEKKQFELKYRLIVGGQTRHTRLTARKSSDDRHVIIGVENIEDEVIKEKEHLKALNTEKELARRDELTGTRNKTAFSELEQSIQENINNGMTYLPFAIAVCDLNNLKKTNDTEGHKAGDEYIKASADLLCRIFDHSPVFRIGGDEFAILLRGEDYSFRKDLVARLREVSMSNRDKHDGPVIAVGMSEFDPSGDTDVKDIFERADQLMYEDKRKLKGEL